MKAVLGVIFLLSVTIAVPINEVNPHNGDEDFDIEPRIAGGQVAKLNQFPYQVGLKLTKFINGGIFSAWCGGSLISDKVVLTAAHCLESTSAGTVYLGAHNRDEAKESGRVTIKIKKTNMIIHEKYDSFFHSDDIALIVLPQKVNLNDQISVINLPHSSNMLIEGRTAIASGWGKMGDGQSSSSLLRYVEQKIVPDKSCMKDYGTLFPTQLCVDTSNGKSTCQGDSGGPLAIEENGSKIVVGLTSYGKAKGCEKGIPVVFTRVSAYLDWIRAKVGISI